MNGQEFLIKMNELFELNKEACQEFAKATEAALRSERPLMLAVDEESADEDKLLLDRAITNAAPVVGVPAHSEFFPLQENGHRFALAADGLYLEVRRPWLHFIHRVNTVSSVRIPYGQLANKVEFTFGRLTAAMPQLQEFALHASADAPIEAAASIIWNSKTATLHLARPETIGQASASSIQFKQIELGEDEHLIIDLHSHGNGPAFFSSTDDQDDAGSVKIAGVYGSLDQTPPTLAFRLCVLGLMIPLAVPVDKIFA